MPKRKKPPEKPKDQFKRFLETAHQHEVDDKTAKDIERSFSRIAPSTKRSGASSKT